MKGKLFTRIVLLITCLAFVLPGNAGAVNYDESKVPDYVLPDVLTCADGTSVSSVQRLPALETTEPLPRAKARSTSGPPARGRSGMLRHSRALPYQGASHRS